MEVSTEYIAVGGNRHPSSADWDSKSSLLAFGADRNIAICRPLDERYRGVETLLSGHTGAVNAVRFFHVAGVNETTLLSGSVDQTLRIWRGKQESSNSFHCDAILRGHTGSINCLTVTKSSSIFASGAADASIRVWKSSSLNGECSADLLQIIQIRQKFFPLTLAISSIGDKGALLLAAAGTKSTIQIYVANTQEGVKFDLQATLSGHDGWIRSLDLIHEGITPGSDILLASASQDKYIRIWRIHRGEDLPAATSDQDLLSQRTLSNKARRFYAADIKYLLTFEALLLGHEDWIYTVQWRRNDNQLLLVSASADNSLAIWERDTDTGVWIASTRLGDLSVQKGSTTATGSTGGFWIGLWSPTGNAIISVGRTGSWRIWRHNQELDRWEQAIGLHGHVRSVTGIAWSKDGSYLLSASSDQTTRLHAEWTRGSWSSWHEFSRPQIHGYDINCIDTLQHTRFISGADEKLLRVFDEPGAVAEMLERLCHITRTSDTIAEAANIPALGLSNKAIEVIEVEEHQVEKPSGDSSGTPAVARKSTLQTDKPPTEALLSRYTMWPEVEKLYGHGYEISAVAASNDSKIVATACKASSIDHAVIRLFETGEWRQINPVLTAHALTVTCLRFNHDDSMLLSVSRDRQWTVFRRDEVSLSRYIVMASGPKAHSRMILGATWAPPTAGMVFATAGRDKTVKVWAGDHGNFVCKRTTAFSSPVTTVDFSPSLCSEAMILAIGTEAGDVVIHLIDIKAFTLQKTYDIPSSLCPSLSITQLAWRPFRDDDGTRMTNQVKTKQLLAMASEDSSMRVLSIKLGTRHELADSHTKADAS